MGPNLLLSACALKGTPFLCWGLNAHAGLVTFVRLKAL